MIEFYFKNYEKQLCNNVHLKYINKINKVFFKREFYVIN